MSFIKRHKVVFFVWAGIIILYFTTRLYNILELPIFTDEAIYIRWAQIAKQDANWRFISLTDGKQPMFVWLTMITMRFIEDPLLAGRLVSVMAGFFIVIGLFFLGRELFKNKWIGALSSFLYSIYPMALVYDRMALYETLVGTFAVWSLFLIVLLARKVRLDVALTLGMVVGAGVLTKTNAFFSIYLLPVSLILFDWSKKRIKLRLIKWIALVTVSVVITYGFYSVLRLSPFFHIIAEKNALFVYPLKDWFDHPFEFFIGNWKAVWDWLTIYMTYPMVGVIVSSFFIVWSLFREKLVLLIWFLIPAIALALFGKTLYPRFIFFMTLFLLPLAAFSFFKFYNIIKNKLIFYICLLAAAILQIKTDYFILNDFGKAPIPRSDVSQYNNDWPSGGGIKQAVEFFRNKAQKEKIYIATQGTFGLLPFALEIYLVDNPNVKIEGYWPIGDEIPLKVLKESKKNSTYFVFYQPCGPCEDIGLSPPAWNVEKILQEKRGVASYMTVYKVR